MLTISNGVTFKGFKSLLGGILFIVSFPITIILLVNFEFEAAIILFLFTFLGAMLFLAIKGIQIEKDRMRIRQYADYLIFKTGSWEKIKDLKHVALEYSKERHTPGSVARRYYDAGSRNIISFDVYLITKEKILIKENPRYNNAVNIAQEVSNYLGCTLQNNIPENGRK